MADLGSLLGSAGIGGAIGKAIVSLELDTKKYQAELKGAQASTVASTNAMGQSTSRFGGLASSAFKVAGVAAVAFAAYSVKAAIEADNAQLKLQNTFANNPKLADSSAAAFTRQADALRDLTGVDDEAIISGQALLGQFDLTGEQVQQLTPAIVDLSAKMGIDLEAAFKAVGKATTGSAGVLSRYGIVLDADALAADAFGTTLEGLGVAEGFAADRAEAEPWRVLGAQFEEVAEQVGKALLPALQGLAGFAKTLVPLLKIAAENLDLVLTALAGYAVLKFLPGLLFSIASGFEAMGFAAASQRLLQAAFGVGALGTAFATAAVPAAAFATVFGGVTAAVAAWDPLKLVGDTDKLRESMEVHDVVLGRVARSSNLVGESNAEWGAELDNTVQSVSEASQAAEIAQGQIDNLAHTTAEATKAAHRFGMTRKVFQDFKESVAESVEVGIGEFEKLGDAFDTTPKELQKALNLAIQIAKREQRVLREIFADDSLTKAQKTALAELPANMRDAWSQAGKAGKQQIEKDAVELKNLNSKNFREITNAAKGPAKEGGKGVGQAFTAGAATGILDGSSELNSAARRVIRDAINAAKAEAGVESPSKVMHRLGLDMMEGLYQGITTAAQKVIDAARKSIEKLISQISSQLDKVKGLASEFAGTISGAIGGFGDIGGPFTSALQAFQSGQGQEGFTGSAPNLSEIIQQQLAGAQALADALEALKRQGAGKALLEEAAEAGLDFAQALLQGGPDQIKEANEALKTIADLAKETGKGLSEKFFGDRIDKLERRLERQNELMKELVELERLGHSHAIILNGQKVSEAIRDELINTGGRNPDIFGGRA